MLLEVHLRIVPKFGPIMRLITTSLSGTRQEVWRYIGPMYGTGTGNDVRNYNETVCGPATGYRKRCSFALQTRRHPLARLIRDGNVLRLHVG